MRRSVNKYHHWDYNSPYGWAGNYNYPLGGGGDNYSADFMAHEFLPLQVTSEERAKPWVFQGDLDEDFLDRAYRFKNSDKQYLKKEGITDTDKLGAVLTVDTSDEPWTMNQYWTDGAWPINSTSFPWYQKKLCDSFQAVIEHLCSSERLCWPVDSTYISNWESVNDDTWSLAKESCEAYPLVSDEYWGCNGSGFELILKKLGTAYYDWYFDTSNSYVPDSIKDYQSDNELTDSDMGLDVLKGTWRRTWKYTMGRIKNGYMRSSEMGTPTGDSYHPFAHWSGTYVSTMPTRAAFDTSSFTTISAKTNYSVTVSTSTAAYFSKGDLIRCYDTNDDIEDNHDIYAWVVKKETDGSNVKILISHDISEISLSDLKIGFNANLASRHDPIKIEFNSGSTTPYPKYKLDYRMIQHAYDVLTESKYFRYPAQILTKCKYFAQDFLFDGENMRYSEAFAMCLANINYCQRPEMECRF